MTQKKTKTTTTTKVDAELARMARTVAAFRGVELYEYLDSVLRAPVAADYRKIVKADGQAEKGGKS